MSAQRNIRLLQWYNFFIQFIPYTPVAILYFAIVSGSYALAGSVVAVSFISGALFELPTGVLSDLYGKRNVLLFGVIATIISTLFYAWGFGFWALIAGSVFSGLARALQSGNNDAFLYESVVAIHTEDAYAKILGNMNAIIQVGLGSSAILGGVLASYSYTVLMWVSVIPPVLALICALFLKEVREIPRETAKIHLHLKEATQLFLGNKKLRLVSLYAMISEGVGDASFQMMPAFYATLVPAWGLGISNLINKIAVFLSFVFSDKLIAKLGNQRAMLLNGIYERASALVGLLVPTVASPFYMPTDGVLYGAAMVAKGDLFQRNFSDTHRATMGSFISFGGSLLFGAAALLLGILADHTSPRVALIVLQLLLVPTLFLLVRAYKK